MYLVDTNVISAGAPVRRGATPDLVAWMDALSSMLFLSAMTIAEIEDGIAKLKREGASKRAADLTAWLETLLHLYKARILAFDVETARVAGALSDKARGLGLSPGLADIVIAATAVRHRLTILTRNTRDFASIAVAAHDPFLGLPK